MAHRRYFTHTHTERERERERESPLCWRRRLRSSPIDPLITFFYRELFQREREREMEAVSFVLEKLADPLIKEAIFLYGVSDEINWLKDEFEWMQRFLIDAEAKRRGGNEVIKHWLRKVREVAHQAEDIIDIFTLETQKKRGLLQCFKRYAAFPCRLISRHKVGTEIEGLKDKINHIKQGRTDYNLIETTPTVATDEAIQARRRIYAHLNDTTRVVGLDVHKKKIADRLLDTDIKRRCVVSIVGIGGLGKTTLANKVYNEIKGKFDVSACFSVSEDYKVHEIYKELVKQMKDKSMADLKDYTVDELGEMLREFLAERRYLVVLDDVWSRDVWDRLMREALPEVHNGSRVLLTTRNTDVAKSIDRTIPPYELPFLNEAESWALFLNKAFLPDETCPGELEEIGRRLVKRCGGLPLALEVLGGTLSKKPNSVAWASVAEHFDWSFIDIKRDCSKILELSYDNLSDHHLKSCFLYLGVFPEDSVIRAQPLIELWVAEGFIPHELETHMIMEDKAQEYLEELAGRSMIQVVEKDWLGSSVAGIRTLKIHDLFRDLCIREATEEDLFNIGTTTTLQDTINNHGNNLRRLVVHGDIISSVDFMPSQNLKSILHFGTTNSIPSIIIPNGLKLLRVIHFVGNQNKDEKFPEIFAKMIKNMRHLRYVRLYGYYNIKLDCIRNLCNLQTLDLAESDFLVLPEWLGEIRTLRHLYIYGFNFSCLADVGSLTNLQTLVGINGSEGGWMKRGLEIPLIRTLRVRGLEVFTDSLRKMKYLSSLQVFYYGEVTIPIEIFSGLSENAQLRSLDLWGPMSVRQLPKSLHGFPPNLTTLVLELSELAEDPMATLEKLPYLRELFLRRKSYIGKEMVCSSGGFPRLHMLQLQNLKELEGWRVEDGAMPNLTHLEIIDCTNLRRLPEGLQHLHSLHIQHLNLPSTPPEVGQD